MSNEELKSIHDRLYLLEKESTAKKIVLDMTPTINSLASLLLLVVVVWGGVKLVVQYVL